MVEKQAIFEIIWSLLLLATTPKFHAAFLHKIMESWIRRTEENKKVIYLLKSSYPDILSSSPSSLLAEYGKQKGFYKTIVATFGAASAVPLVLDHSHHVEIRTSFIQRQLLSKV